MQRRIGILTYHRSNNYGALIQAYSLSSRLKKDFPESDVEIVDYISEEVYLQYNPSFSGYCKLIAKAKPYRRKISYLEAFAKYIKIHGSQSTVQCAYFEEARKMLPLSDTTIVTDDFKSICKYLNSQYDILVVGSDAVWNWQIRKFPNPYFLGPEIKAKKLSYAASSYGQPYKELSASKLKYLKSSWSEYLYLGVRDKATEDFVKYANPILVPVHNCDPTVFLDMESLPVDKVKEKLIRAGYDSSKKTVGLMAKPWLASLVKARIGNEYQIVSVFNYNKEADVNLLDINPFEWAVVFSFFDVTITHYFHGNLLSLKNGTPTLIIEQRSSYNQEYCSKIRDFMNRINLQEFCFYADEDVDINSELTKLIGSEQYNIRLNDGLEKEKLSIKEFEDILRTV